MKKISKWSVLAGSLLALIALPASAIDSARICADAAAVLIDGDAYAQPEKSRGYGLSDPVIVWSSDEGYEGTCLLDSEGRVYEVTITQFPSPPSSDNGQAYGLTCSSDKGRRKECRLRNRSEVRLEKQLSKNPCIEGRSWGQNDTTLWVSDGCRGRFLISPLPTWTTHTIRCESLRGTRKQCPVKSDAEVRLVRKESRTECRKGENWGHYGDTLWVDNGCRGIFEVKPRGSWGSGDESLKSRADRACRARADSHGFDVLRITNSTVTGRYVEVEMPSERRSVRVNLLCRYNSTNNSTELFSQ